MIFLDTGIRIFVCVTVFIIIFVMCASPQKHVFLERQYYVKNAKIYFSLSYVVIDP